MVETLLVVLVAGVAVLLVLQVWTGNQRTRSASEQELTRTQAEAELRELVKPLRERIESYQQAVQELETQRAKQEGALSTQLRELTRQYEGLQGQTNDLVTALKDSGARGTWGQIQLRRIVELAGMVAYCDFEEQVHASGGGHEGAVRPDLVVRLPGGTSIAVDAKAPGDAFFAASEAPEPAQADRLFEQFSARVMDHVKQLAAKSYWDRIQPAPEFVVMFLPVEPMLAAAARHRPALLEEAARLRVIVATPTSLIAILRAAAFGWRQEKIADDARHVADLANDMAQRVITLWSHFDKVGRGLDTAIEAFNRAVGSFETRVRPTARKLEEHVEKMRDLKQIEPISKSGRSLPSSTGGDSEESS